MTNTKINLNYKSNAKLAAQKTANITSKTITYIFFP